MCRFYRFHRLFIFCALLAACFSVRLYAAERHFIVLHTNDWQSRLLGFAPNSAYTPDSINDDNTVGGVARLATLIGQRRAAAGDTPLLLLDAGDFSMGTLFHTITREQAPELKLLSALGYDATTLGNHEFDFRPQGLAEMISAAQQDGRLLPIVASNLRFDPLRSEDDALEAHWLAGRIQPYRVIVRGGIRFGLFGLLGHNAIEVSPMASPVTFADPVQSARDMVKMLREYERVDVVILLSHMGVRKEEGGFGGEEVELAKQVPGIDLIIGGHSHTALTRPVLADGHVPIVQAGSELEYLGELHMSLPDNGAPRVDYYRLHRIDDRILGDAAISAEVEGFKQQVNEKILAPLGYRFDQPLAHLDRHLVRAQHDAALGNLVTDALRRAGKSDIALTGGGTLRDDLYPGTQAVSDLFRLLPLGIGEHEQTPGYPLVKVYFTGAEIKSILEVMLLAWKWRDESYYPYFSGIRITFNPYRVPFDRISRLEVGDDSRGWQPLELEGKRLYSVTASSYVGSFLWLIPHISKGFLHVTPKDADGKPYAHLGEAVIDRDPLQDGVQEYKEWQALLDYVHRLPDLDGDGLPDIPTTGAATESRLRELASLAPAELFRNSGHLQWVVSAAPLLVLMLLLWILIGTRHHKRLSAQRSAAMAQSSSL